jgi:hypothetical protein
MNTPSLVLPTEDEIDNFVYFELRSYFDSDVDSGDVIEIKQAVTNFVKKYVDANYLGTSKNKLSKLDNNT